MGLINTFNPAPQRDGSNVVSTAHVDYITANISNGDSYLDNTSEIKEISIYYEHEQQLEGTTGERQKKRIHHFVEDNFDATVSWSPIARDGTWIQARIRVSDYEDATAFYYAVNGDYTSESLILT